MLHSYIPLLLIIVHVKSKCASTTYSNYGIFGSIIHVHPSPYFFYIRSHKTKMCIIS